ncbi:hypothetical protein [Rathayibacter sp. VKM Ac-2927]|uniref:hypothetical protein n=1 Tax=Rathayibacter sp. VKM Ac-2927 TaxID=2929478 RepID=UPI001FB2CCC1|nr:hypothetical protein [Rathayibacter sp. VKM Ac-2927]MCJ1687862.1 hypothetical protein [Rathayibacter sp. VKM Ac-2927]
MPLERNPPDPSLSAYRYSSPLHFVRLFLPDLESVKTHLNQNAGSVTLSAGGATTTTADDLREATPSELKEVAFLATDPHMVVWLNKSFASIDTFEDSDAARALVDSTAGLLRETYGRSFLAAYVSILKFFAIGLSFSFGFAGLLTLSLGLDTQIKESEVAFAFALCVFILVALGVITTYLARQVWARGSAKITPSTRDEHRRSGKSTTTLVWSTIGAAVVTGVITYFVTIATIAAG